MDIIVNHLAPYAITIVADAESAKEMWDNLTVAYHNQTAANQMHLLNKIFHLKMNVNDKIKHHYAKLDALISELKMSGVEIGDSKC